MVRTYLEGRDNLQALLLLFDIRRVPQQEEIQLLDWLEELQVPTIPIITKVDKITRSRREKQIEPILEATGLPRDAFTLFSALSREGCDEVWQRIEAALDEDASPVLVDADD